MTKDRHWDGRRRTRPDRRRECTVPRLARINHFTNARELGYTASSIGTHQ